MTATALSEKIALRIGLAARMLPDTDPTRILKVLGDAVGLPPTEKSLEGLKLKVFKAAADGELADIDNDILKSALAVLKGDAEPEVDDAPELQAYAEGDLLHSIRVACASNSKEELDGHFGSCRRFLIYQVSAEEARLIDVRRVGRPQEEQDKNDYRAELIADCDVLFVNSIGGPAAAKVVKRDIHPIKNPQVVAARTKVEELSTILGGSPPPWLAKVMGEKAKTTEKFLATEDAE